MVEYSLALSTGSFAHGKSIVIVTNAGGPSVIAVDMCHDLGIDLNPLPFSVCMKLKELLPMSSIENPIDITGDPRPERFKVALEAVLENESVDGVILIVIGPLKGGEEVGKLIQDAKRTYKKPIVVCWLSREFAGQAPKELYMNGVPVFKTPESAVRAMYSLIKYGMYKRKLSQKAL